MNHDSLRIIHNPGYQKSIILSLELNSTIAFQGGTSEVKIPEWRQHVFTCRQPSLISPICTIRGCWDRPDKNPGALCRCPANMILNIPNCEIHWPGMFNAQIIGPVSPVRCTNDWHNHRSGRELFLCMPPPITHVNLAHYSVIF